MTARVDPEARLKTAEVATIFRVTQETVRNWIDEGKFPNTIQPGRGFLILGADVLRVLNEEYGPVSS